MKEHIAPYVEELTLLAEQASSAAGRRRAQVLLGLHRGDPVAEIAQDVALSIGRVRHWRRQFMTKGLHIFSVKDRALLQNGHLNGVAEAALADIQLGNAFADPEGFVNRELSLLEFQRRVLEEAQDEDLPLMERLKFLAILGSNLDEFFMVRVGGLKQQMATGVTEASADGMTLAEQLAAIRKVTLGLMEEARTCFNALLPAFHKSGIHILDYKNLKEKQKRRANRFFEEIIFPILTPMGFDPGHPFPHISNLSLNLAVLLRDPKGEEHFVRIKIPKSIPRLLPVKRSSGGQRKDGTVPHNHYFVWAEQVIAANLEALFPGMEILSAHTFRVTRNADFDIQELEADDLLETMEQGVYQRQFGAVVRVGFNPDLPMPLRVLLIENLEADQKDVYTLDGPLGFADLMGVYKAVGRADLRERPYLPTVPRDLRIEGPDMSIFRAIRQKNILIHHPYDSFVPVIDFLEAAARDPNVLAIKQTLYRVGKNAPIVQALLQARRNGKQVTVLVELKARFDEESNIEWAKKLEQEGVHVIYGLLGLKTHSKIALVVRREGLKMRRYVHLSTGNYNAVTAHLYEDLGYFTADLEIGADASDLFNYVTGYSAKQDYRKLIIAPIALRERMIALIRREIAHQRAGHTGRLIFKMNSLVDTEIIRWLYKASEEGISVDLIVRGICCLRPGVAGLSENIRVTSIVGRFLEHSRIYYFHNAGKAEVYLGSADMMPRNLNRRVEVVFPVEDLHWVRHLRDNVLAVYLNDTESARVMQSDGTYKRRHATDGTTLSAQTHFMTLRQKR